MYDIAIIGVGVSSAFFIYQLTLHMPKLNILLLEKGDVFSKRVCPIELGHIHVCGNCDVCKRLSGFGGLGKSEGKFNYTLDFGGDLHKKIGEEAAWHAMETVDEILCSFGGDQAPLYDTTNDTLTSRLPSQRYRTLSAKVRHLGLKLSSDIFQNLEATLSTKVDMRSNVNITKVMKTAGQFHILLHNGTSLKTKKLVIATGQSGGDFLINLCKEFDIIPQKTRLDLGIRVEIPDDYLLTTLADTFEVKIEYQDDNIIATTYCMNPHGCIIKKRQYGLVMADGQNYLQSKATNYLNFTIFVPFYFTRYSEAREYAKDVISNINQGRERILCQRYADFLQKLPTSASALERNSIVPTITCEPGNLWDELPIPCIHGASHIFKVLNHLENSNIPDDTLLYGIDAKFYEPEISTDIDFQSNVPNLYFIGDCSGVTYSISQAAASGVYLAARMVTGVFSQS